MAHVTTITSGGLTYPVTEFDSTAQQIDDAVAVLGGASTPQEALANLGAGVRPSLLDNGCFVGGGTGWGVFPVNQRGKASYGSGYVFDRWALNGGTLTLKPSGASWDSGFVLNQGMGNLNLADGKTRTVSYVDENMHGFSGLLTKDYTIIGDYSFTFSTGTRFYAMSRTLSPAMAWVKLEDGDDQTLFVENGDGTVTVLPQNLDYHTELAKCKYFFNRYNYVQGTLMGFGFANSATELGLLFKIPPMRANPAITVSSFSNIKISQSTLSAGISPTGISSSFIDGEGNVNIALTVSGGLTPGAVYRVGLLGGYIQFNAEL